jgi:hypothetical protein
LHVSQPTPSQQIRQLEDTLLDRTAVLLQRKGSYRTAARAFIALALEADWDT